MLPCRSRTWPYSCASEQRSEDGDRSGPQATMDEGIHVTRITVSAGVLLVVFPTVMYGGLPLLSFLEGTRPDIETSAVARSLAMKVSFHNKNKNFTTKTKKSLRNFRIGLGVPELFLLVFTWPGTNRKWLQQ
jgi:hypothetical protein